MNENIGAEAVAFYENLFKEDYCGRDFSILDCIPSLITDTQNVELIRMSDEEEVKKVVIILSDDSASGPDEFSGVFY